MQLETVVSRYSGGRGILMQRGEGRPQDAD